MPIFFRKTRRELASQRSELASRGRALEKREQALARAAEDLMHREERLNALLESRAVTLPVIAQAWHDWELALSEAEAEALRRKKHPALKASEEIQRKGREVAEARRRMKLAEYTARLYESYFPWLEELRDPELESSYIDAGEQGDDVRDDPVARYVSSQEWASLPEVERNQRALDRYLRSKMTAWQLGRDYERYVGYLRERDGCTVTYHGIVHGFDDLGRDVVAERNGRIEVIQCKRWAQHKTIHEKHVFQLYGTMIAAKIENPSKEVAGTFVTTTTLSERARAFALVLDIIVHENFALADYPRIKCNVSRGGERIYHLPFDQQYDTTVIDPRRGERYVATCQEAEDLGFRRAWRWKGTPPG